MTYFTAEQEKIMADAVAEGIGKSPNERLRIAREAGQKIERREQLAELSQWPHELQHVSNLGTTDYRDDDRGPADVDRANIYTSRIEDGPHAGQHTIVLDLDVPARLVPSSTPGHSHLFIDVPLGWLDYATLLHELARLGVIEHGYNAASQHREFSAVRLPWVRKPGAPDPDGDQ